MSNNTSLLGAALGVQGLLLRVGSSGSPETMCVIVNSTDYDQPLKADQVEVTNFGDNFKRRITTLKDLGPIQFMIFWIPEEPSHRNSANGGAVAAGMRYLLINNVLADFQVNYPNGTTDAFAAYVADFSVKGKTGDVFRASVTLAVNDGAPSLV